MASHNRKKHLDAVLQMFVVPQLRCRRCAVSEDLSDTEEEEQTVCKMLAVSAVELKLVVKSLLPLRVRNLGALGVREERPIIG